MPKLTLALSILSAVVSAFFAYLYYALYWQWRGLFENGHYFNIAESVVYNDDACFYLAPALLFLGLAALLFKRYQEMR